MIIVNRKDGCITIEGHAGYAPRGQDIVCAAISTLAQTLIYSIEELTEDKITYVSKPGTVEINYRDLSANAQLLIDSFFVGVNMIADSYLTHVRVDQALKS